MTDHIIPYDEASEAARRASICLDETEYRGFYEISDGGVLTCEKNTGELRVSGDVCGTLDGTCPKDVRAITRDYITCDSSCLNTDDVGRVCVKIRK